MRQYAIPPTLREWLSRVFVYHPAAGDQGDRYGAIRKAGQELALKIATLCPAGEDRRTAVEKVREAVMWANAAIACGEEHPHEVPGGEGPGAWVGKKVKLREGWKRDHRDDRDVSGDVLGPPVVLSGQAWVPVVWEGEDDPSWIKTVAVIRS